MNPRETSGHNFNMIVKRSNKDPRKYNFGVRTIKLWNSLTDDIVYAESIKDFEMLLDERWKDQDLYQNDFESEIRIGTRATARYRDFVV